MAHDPEALRELLQSIVADRKRAGESLADVGRTLAKIIAPDHLPISRQYLHGMAAGRTTIPAEIAQALHTYAALHKLHPPNPHRKEGVK